MPQGRHDGSCDADNREIQHPQGRSARGAAAAINRRGRFVIFHDRFDVGRACTGAKRTVLGPGGKQMVLRSRQLFQGQYTDFHMFKVRNGEVHGVHAVLAKASGPGW